MYSQFHQNEKVKVHLNLFVKICVGEWEKKYNTYLDMWFTM